MTRVLRVISGSDQSPTIDFTDDVDWPDASFQMMASNGDSGVGNVAIYDEDGVIPDFLGNKFVNSHNVVTFDDGPYRLFRGRIGSKETGRKLRKGKRVKIVNLICGDYNTDTRGIVVHGFNRPLESNIVRVQALAAQYLAGSPRATTNLNATTYVSASNALTIPAKDYSGMYVADVLSDIAQTAGKLWFVTVDGELFYDGSESTAYASGLRISDDEADQDGVTYYPQWDEGAAATENGLDQITRLRTYYGTESSVTSSTGQDAYYDYWEGLWWDPLAETAANAQIRSDARLSEFSQDSLTVACTIGPIPWAQLPLIKPGQTIQFKARGARGGRGPTGTFTGDSFITLRIATLTWKTPSPDTYFASLNLSRPPKISAGGTGDQALVTANEKAAICEGLVASSCSDLFNRVAADSWARSTILCRQWYASADGLHRVEGYGYQERVLADTAPTDWIDLTEWNGANLEFLALCSIGEAGGSRAFHILQAQDPLILLPAGPQEVGDSNRPQFSWEFSFFGGTNLGLKVVASSNGVVVTVGSVDTGIAISDGTKFWLRCRLEWNAIRMRGWLDGSAEPGTWQAQGTGGGSPSFLQGTRSLDDANFFAVRHKTSAQSTGWLKLESLEFVSGLACSGVSCDMCGTVTTEFGST